MTREKARRKREEQGVEGASRLSGVRWSAAGEGRECGEGRRGEERRGEGRVASGSRQGEAHEASAAEEAAANREEPRFALHFIVFHFGRVPASLPGSLRSRWVDANECIWCTAEVSMPIATAPAPAALCKLVLDVAQWLIVFDTT